MNRILLALLLFSCWGCHQNIIAEAQDLEQTALDYYLQFDITNIDYVNPDEQQTVSVSSTQDVAINLSFQELSTLDRYLYFASYHPVSDDSITLIGQLHFDLDEETPFQQEEFLLEFILIEARANLTEQPDQTFRYNDLELLATHLQNNNWTESGFVDNGQLNQFLLSFPNVDLGEHTMPNYTLTSNGFYFEHEQLEFSDVVYHSETNTIDLSGNFTVEMKELSCGFYSYFFIENARFQALIH